MSQKLTPAQLPISEKALRLAVRKEVPHTSKDYDGPTGDPFGDVSTQVSHRNELSYNSAVWPRNTLFGEETTNEYIAPQHFERAQSVADVIQVAAFLATRVIESNNLEEYPTLAHWITDKLAEGWAFRVGIIETVAEQQISVQMGIDFPKRTLEKVAKDEKNDIDLRGKDDVFQVKFNNNAKVSKNVRRVDVCENNGMLEIEVSD